MDSWCCWVEIFHWQWHMAWQHWQCNCLMTWPVDPVTAGQPVSFLADFIHFCGVFFSSWDPWAGIYPVSVIVHLPPVLVACFSYISHDSSISWHYRITESLRWKRPPRLSSPSFDWSPPCQLERGAECHIHSSPEHLQGVSTISLCSQFLPTLSMKKFFLNFS